MILYTGSAAFSAQVVAVANHKGGVGKTTTAINISAAMACTQKRVLLIDLDAQGNASSSLGLQQKLDQLSSYHLLTKRARWDDVVQQTSINNLDLIPASLELSSADLELVHMEQREYQLRRILTPALSTYDYILLDCPPSISLVTLNGLCFAKHVLIPLQCEYFALEGLSYLIKTIKKLQRRYNKNLSVLGIVLTMHDGRNLLTQSIEHEVRNYFQDWVFPQNIPRNVRIAEAQSHGLPVLLHDPSCRGSLAYLNLAKNLLQKLEDSRGLENG